MVAQSALPAPGVEELKRLFDQGRYEEVVAFTASSSPCGDYGRIKLIQARAFLRIDTDDARAQAETIAESLLGDTDARCEAKMVLALASIYKHDTKASRRFLEEARTSASSEQLAEIGYSLAYCDYLEERFEPSVVLTYGAFNTKNLRLLARAHYLKAFMHHGADDTVSFVQSLSASASFVLRLESFDVETGASIAHNLISGAMEIGDRKAVALGEQVYSRFVGGTYPEVIQEQLHTATRALAKFYALEGDTGQAGRLLRRASLTAPSPAYRVLSIAERAMIALASRETAWVRDSLFEAEDVGPIDWAASKGEEPIALTLLARLYAESEPARAKVYAETFVAVQETQRAQQRAHRTRLQAMYDMATASILDANGETKEAERAYVAAHDGFVKVAHRWRAAEALLCMGKMLKDCATVKRARDMVAETYPNSLIVKNADYYLLMAKFTATERRVIAALVSSQCAPSEDIAADLNVTTYTFNNHVRNIGLKIDTSHGRKGIVAYFERVNLGSLCY